MTARLEIEYDGTDFAGWARQPGLRTVQETLEDALATVLGAPSGLTVAGRTDRGVHARGQVASHAGEAAPADALNGVLPADVRVLSSADGPERFDARRDARSRVYRYRVWTRRAASPFERRYAWHRAGAIDRDAIHAMAAAVVGTHDFTAFTPTQTDHVRFSRDVVRAEWVEAGPEMLEFWIEADTFMRHMVRTLVGTMLLGHRSVEEFAALLEGRPRAEAGDTAPAHGLFLEAVRY